MKTIEEKIEISKQVAEIVGRPASSPFHEYSNFYKGTVKKWLWLAQDHGACAEIAADRLINTEYVRDRYVRAWWRDSEGIVHHHIAQFADFPSRIEATNWAICEAVIEQHKESGK